jgi:hypothetical protein
MRFQPKVLAVGYQPAGARLQIHSMLRLRRNTGKAHILTKFINETVLILLQVGEDSLHGKVIVTVGPHGRLLTRVAHLRFHNRQTQCIFLALSRKPFASRLPAPGRPPAVTS